MSTPVDRRLGPLQKPRPSTPPAVTKRNVKDDSVIEDMEYESRQEEPRIRSQSADPRFESLLSIQDLRLLDPQGLTNGKVPVYCNEGPNEGKPSHFRCPGRVVPSSSSESVIIRRAQIDSCWFNVQDLFLDPDGRTAYYWVAIVTLAVIYNWVTVILRVAFEDTRDIYMFSILDYLSDVIYFLDIFIQARTAHLEDGCLVKDLRSTVKNYQNQAYFYVDVLSIMPFSTILSGAAALHIPVPVHLVTENLKSPILRGFRLLKFHSMKNYFNKSDSRTNCPNLLRAFKLSLHLWLVIHWIACFYYIMSKYEGLGINDWVYPSGPEYSTFKRKYILSMYWSTMTLTTIGERPPPVTDIEHLFTGLIYLIGVFVFATVVGNVGEVISNVNASRREFQCRMDRIKLYLELHKVPEILQDRIKRWSEYTWNRTKAIDEHNLLRLLPTRLRTEVAIHVHLKTLKKVRIFEQCDEGLLRDLVLKLRSSIYSPGEYICRIGEIGQEMYIIGHGIVEILLPDRVSGEAKQIAIMTHGNYFGEISLLKLDDGQNKRTADVRSVGYSELLSLSRQDLMEALSEYPDAKNILEAQARQRMLQTRPSESLSHCNTSINSPEPTSISTTASDLFLSSITNRGRGDYVKQNLSDSVPNELLELKQLLLELKEIKKFLSEAPFPSFIDQETEAEMEAAEEILHQKASNVTSFVSLINPTQLKVNVDEEVNERKEVSSDQEMPPMPASLLRTSHSKQVNGKNLKLLPVTCEKMNSYKYEKIDRDSHTTHPSALVNAIRVLPPFESVKFSKKKRKKRSPPALIQKNTNEMDANKHQMASMLPRLHGPDSNQADRALEGAGDDTHQVSKDNSNIALPNSLKEEREAKLDESDGIVELLQQQQLQQQKKQSPPRSARTSGPTNCSAVLPFYSPETSYTSCSSGVESRSSFEIVSLSSLDANQVETKKDLVVKKKEPTSSDELTTSSCASVESTSSSSARAVKATIRPKLRYKKSNTKFVSLCDAKVKEKQKVKVDFSKRSPKPRLTSRAKDKKRKQKNGSANVDTSDGNAAVLVKDSMSSEGFSLPSYTSGSQVTDSTDSVEMVNVPALEKMVTGKCSDSGQAIKKTCTDMMKEQLITFDLFEKNECLNNQRLYQTMSDAAQKCSFEEDTLKLGCNTSEPVQPLQKDAAEASPEGNMHPCSVDAKGLTVTDFHSHDAEIPSTSVQPQSSETEEDGSPVIMDRKGKGICPLCSPQKKKVTSHLCSPTTEKSKGLSPRRLDSKNANPLSNDLQQMKKATNPLCSPATEKSKDLSPLRADTKDFNPPSNDMPQKKKIASPLCSPTIEKSKSLSPLQSDSKDFNPPSNDMPQKKKITSPLCSPTIEKSKGLSPLQSDSKDFNPPSVDISKSPSCSFLGDTYSLSRSAMRDNRSPSKSFVDDTHNSSPSPASRNVTFKKIDDKQLSIILAKRREVSSPEIRLNNAHTDSGSPSLVKECLTASEPNLSHMTLETKVDNLESMSKTRQVSGETISNLSSTEMKLTLGKTTKVEKNWREYSTETVWCDRKQRVPDVRICTADYQDKKLSEGVTKNTEYISTSTFNDTPIPYGLSSGRIRVPVFFDSMTFSNRKEKKNNTSMLNKAEVITEDNKSNCLLSEDYKDQTSKTPEDKACESTTVSTNPSPLPYTDKNVSHELGGSSSDQKINGSVINSSTDNATKSDTIQWQPRSPSSSGINSKSRRARNRNTFLEPGMFSLCQGVKSECPVRTVESLCPEQQPLSELQKSENDIIFTSSNSNQDDALASIRRRYSATRYRAQSMDKSKKTLLSDMFDNSSSISECNTITSEKSKNDHKLDYVFLDSTDQDKTTKETEEEIKEAHSGAKETPRNPKLRGKYLRRKSLTKRLSNGFKKDTVKSNISKESISTLNQDTTVKNKPSDTKTKAKETENSIEASLNISCTFESEFVSKNSIANSPAGDHKQPYKDSFSTDDAFKNISVIDQPQNVIASENAKEPATNVIKEFDPLQELISFFSETDNKNEVKQTTPTDISSNLTSSDSVRDIPEQNHKGTSEDYKEPLEQNCKDESKTGSFHLSYPVISPRKFSKFSTSLKNVLDRSKNSLINSSSDECSKSKSVSKMNRHLEIISEINGSNHMIFQDNLHQSTSDMEANANANPAYTGSDTSQSSPVPFLHTYPALESPRKISYRDRNEDLPGTYAVHGCTCLKTGHERQSTNELVNVMPESSSELCSICSPINPFLTSNSASLSPLMMSSLPNKSQDGLVQQQLERVSDSDTSPSLVDSFLAVISSGTVTESASSPASTFPGTDSGSGSKDEAECEAKDEAVESGKLELSAPVIFLSDFGVNEEDDPVLTGLSSEHSDIDSNIDEL